jgi:hypothetical protein
MLQFVIGSTGNTLPDPPAPRTRFVIGASANGAEVRRPLTKSHTVGAAALFAPRRSEQPSSRTRTVIGAASTGRSSSASNSGRANPGRARNFPQPATRKTSSSNRRQSGIVIGLRNNFRRKRFVI